MARLASHVLDAASGRSAGGREPKPWSRANLSPETYGSRFFAGDYPRRLRIEFDEPAFLDVIPICFDIAHEQPHAHALSPYDYSTCRGS